MTLCHESVLFVLDILEIQTGSPQTLCLSGEQSGTLGFVWAEWSKERGGFGKDHILAKTWNSLESQGGQVW